MASYMSQETLEYKSEYMSSGDPDRRKQCLSDILHIVRQRMADNEEELRMMGMETPRMDMYGSDGRLDTMLVFGRDPEQHNTDRSNLVSKYFFNL